VASAMTAVRALRRSRNTSRGAVQWTFTSQQNIGNMRLNQLNWFRHRVRIKPRQQHLLEQGWKGHCYLFPLRSLRSPRVFREAQPNGQSRSPTEGNPPKSALRVRQFPTEGNPPSGLDSPSHHTGNSLSAVKKKPGAIVSPSLTNN